MIELIAKAPINKGFSGDRKYCAISADGTKYLLRVMPHEKHETWQKLFAMLERVVSLGIPMSKPVELDIRENSVYALFTWIDGEDLQDALPKLPQTEQYKLGLQAGEILRLIHTLPAPEDEEDWAAKYNRSIEQKLKAYRENQINHFDGSEHFIRYIEQNRHLIEGRPQCFTHGDFSVPNMMLENGELRIIDFDRYKFGDPWSEFFKTVFSARISAHFTTGQLHGYFGGEPPPEFFPLMALYTTPLTAMSWAIPHGRSEIDFVLRLLADTLRWFDNMNNPVPTWYLKEYRG